MIAAGAHGLKLFPAEANPPNVLKAMRAVCRRACPCCRWARSRPTTWPPTGPRGQWLRPRLRAHKLVPLRAGLRGGFAVRGSLRRCRVKERGEGGKGETGLKGRSEENEGEAEGESQRPRGRSLRTLHALTQLSERYGARSLSPTRSTPATPCARTEARRRAAARRVRIRAQCRAAQGQASERPSVRRSGARRIRQHPYLERKRTQPVGGARDALRRALSRLRQPRVASGWTRLRTCRERFQRRAGADGTQRIQRQHVGRPPRSGTPGCRAEHRQTGILDVARSAKAFEHFTHDRHALLCGGELRSASAAAADLFLRRSVPASSRPIISTRKNVR